MNTSIPTPLAHIPLNAADEDLLCGRAADVETIVRNCHSGRLTVVTSSPGLGASSLLRAGVEPALRRDGFTTAVYSDWQGPSIAARLRETILRAIHEQADGAFTTIPHEPLVEFLTRAERGTGRPVAILLDQFEDYVRCHTGTDVSNNFDAELANAISARAGRFVIVLQNTSIAAFERLSQSVPNLMGFTVKLAPLTTDAAEELVDRIVARARIDVEPAARSQLVSSPLVLVTDVSGDSAGVHPLFLTLATQRLVRAESNLGSYVARVSTLTASGGPDRLILESLDPALLELGSTHAQLLFRWIPLLISAEGLRLAASEKALMERSGRLNRFGMTLLPILVKSGLMRTVATSAGLRYEFARESTAVVVHDWWHRREAEILARQRAQFRTRSLSLSGGAIVLAYLIYLWMK